MLNAIKIINDNFLHHATFLQSRTPGMQTIHGGGLSYSDSGLSCDTFNILYITDAQAFNAADFHQAVRHYTAKQFDFCVWINEENLSSSVRNALANAGLSEAGNEPGMIIYLEEYSSTGDVRKLNTLDDFARLVSCNWQPPDQNVVDFYSRVKPVHSEYFASYVNGEPVSVVELFPDTPANVGIYSLYTLPGYRGKGIATDLMKHCLHHLKSKGYITATLQAADDGLNIYKKLGFVPATRFYEFKKM